MSEKVNLAENLATFEGTFQPKVVGYYEPRGTPNTGDSGVEAAPEAEI